MYDLKIIKSKDNYQKQKVLIKYHQDKNITNLSSGRLIQVSSKRIKIYNTTKEKVEIIPAKQIEFITFSDSGIKLNRKVA